MKNICVVCGEKCNNKFCSISCRNKFWNPVVKPYSNGMNNRSKKIEISKTCIKCGKLFNILIGKNSNPNRYRNTCSRSCANSHVRTEESKKKQSSNFIGKLFDRNSKLWIDKKKRTCVCCGNSIQGKKKYCSKSCREKIRPTSENKKEVYRRQCKFKFNPYNYPDILNISLLDTYGFYSPSNKKNNLHGVSMDHRVSITHGYDNNVDPYYMSHVMNCCLLKHTDNISKNSKSSLTISELILLVDEYDKNHFI